MSDVRSTLTTPTVADFISAFGTPIVVDRTTGYAYVLKSDETVAQIGAGSTPTFTQVTITSGTVTVDTPPLTATETWNNAGVTFNGFKLNVTDTASAAASRLIALQVAGADKFIVTKAGAATLSAGLTATTGAFSGAVTGLTFNGNTITSGSGTLTLAASSTLATSGANSITLTSTGPTNVTMPTSGTLITSAALTGYATLTGAETLTNKTITTFAGAFTFNPANLTATLSPTGTGTVTINPATAGTVNNMSVGATTAAAVRATTFTGTSGLTTGTLVITSASTSGLLTEAAALTYIDTSVTRSISVSGSGSGSSNMTVANTHASANAFFDVLANGTGDAYVRYSVSALATRWYAGIDNSVGDRFAWGTDVLGAADKVAITTTGSLIANASGAALATNATDGFTYIPTSAGTPTGAPTAVTGAAAIEVDTTNNLFYYYSGSWLTAPSALASWTAWTPTRTGWTDVGSPTVTARYMRIGKLVHFQIKVVPGTTTATVSGTSYTDLPIVASASGLSGQVTMVDFTTLVSVGQGVIDPANSRAYVPTQGATGDTLTIAGWYEI